MKINLINSVFLALGISVVACTSSLNVDRTNAPKPSKAPVINIPTPKEFTLDNGLRVFLVEDHKLPKVSFQLTVDYDPVLEKDKVGLSDLAGELMGEGTTTKTKEQIDEEIDFIGANLSTYSNGVYISSLSKHSDKVLEIASDIILHPSFPQEQLEKKKRKIISSLKMISTNPNAIADRVGNVLKYGKNHPYGEVQLKEHVENITIADCKKHYDTYFRPNVSYLVIVGDITPEEAKKKAQKYFGNWEKQTVPSHQYPFPPKVKENRVVFVEKPGAVQSLIKIIYPVDYKVGAPNAASVSVMSNIFGGAFSSYLMSNLREDKAYTYGARGGVRPDRLVGSFNASASVRNEVTDSAIVEFLKEMKHIRNEKVKAEDLNRIKNNMNGNFALSLEKPQTIARFALNTARYNLPKDYYQNYLARLAAVNEDSVKQAAEMYIYPDSAIILVIGNTEILEKIKKFDADGEIEILDVNGEPKKELELAPAGMTAEKVIEQYLYVITDLSDMESVKQKFNQVKDITINMEAQIQGMTIQMKSQQMQPNLILTEVSMNGMTMQKQTFDGQNGKASGMQGNKDIEGKELEKLKHDAIMHKEIKYKELGYEMELLGIATVLGKKAYKVRLKSPKGEETFQYYDKNTGLLIYSVTNFTSEDGKAMTTTSEYKDYRNVNGILYPFKRAEQAGQQVIDLEVKNIEINKGLKKSDFQ